MSTIKSFEIGDSTYEVSMAAKGSDGKLAKFSGSSDSTIYVNYENHDIDYDHPDGNFNINFCIDQDYTSITVRINIPMSNVSEEKYLEVHPTSNPDESAVLAFTDSIAKTMGWDSKFVLKLIFGELKMLTKKAICKVNY